MKKRTKEMKEKHLTKIVTLEMKNPSVALSLDSFSSLVSEKLHISIKQAKKDIEEVRKRKDELSLINLKEELAKKKSEYAYIKELALKQNNINAYLGAVNKEAEMLSLEKYSIFVQMQQSTEDDNESTLEEKKQLLFNKLFKEKE